MKVEIPPVAAQVFEKFIACEYAYFSPSGSPLCWPVTPYWYPDRGVLAVATGLAYPNKAVYAAKNPKVAMLFSDPTGSGLSDPPQVYVAGIAKVLDEDLQANTDRYVRELREKFPVARLGLNPLTVKFLDFYLPRLWVEITPVSISLWERGSQNLPGYLQNSVSRAPEGELERVVRAHGEGVIVFKGPDGHPAMQRVPITSRGDGTLSLPITGEGPAALSIHRHTLGGTRFRAYMVRGRLSGDVFVAEKLVGFFGNGLIFPFSVIPEVMRLRRRLHRELHRRGWKMPQLRVP